MSEAIPVRRLSRVVQNDPPTRTDFTSNAALGRPLRPGSSAEARRLWDGLSTTGTLERARAFVEAYGREAVADWVLARNGEGERDFQRIAEGNLLAEHAPRVRSA